MNGDPEAPPSGFLPPRWFIRAAWKTHKALYRWSGGRFGLRTPREDRYGLAHLTTIGRRSGQERSVMIGYYEDGDAIVTMAMNGWGAPEPAWWLNLQAEPEATLTMAGGTTVPVVARRAVGEPPASSRLVLIGTGLDGAEVRRGWEAVLADR